MDLSDYRQQINDIDKEILKLFEQRMAVSVDIANYKKAHDLPVLDSSRESEKLDEVRAALPEELKDYGTSLFSLLMDLSKTHQRKSIGL
ncbi:MAG: chorismate mutase [Lachnospiraceae bacterium]|nr:chorismate mutase [Lachnospiraceae bacterium]